MTDNSKLLPLPSGNVAHLIAAQEAEIEALRAGVERWKGQHMRDSAELRRLCQHRDEYKARAEQLAVENARLREAAKSARDALAVAIKAAWEGSTDADVAEHVVIKKLDAAIDAALAKENSDARAALAKAEGR